MARKSKSSDIPEEPDSYSLPHEAKGVVLLSAAILLLLSLLSFHDGDDRSNWLGLAGFTAAWLCTYFFGLSSYCLPIFLGWWGWRSLWDKPANHLRQRAVYMLVAMVGSSLLLCVWAERSPAFQQWIGRSVYSRHEGPTYVHPPVTPPRYFVGGVPLHYIYADFPRFSLRRLLNDAGVLIVAGTMLLTAVLALGKVQIHTAPDLWERLRSKLKRSPKTDPPMTDGAASTKSFLPSLALPFHGWSTHQEEIDNSLVVDVEGEDEPFITPTTSPLPAQIDEADDEDVIVVSTSKAITPRTPQLAPSQAKDKQAIRKAALDAQRVWNGDYSRYSKPSPQQLSKGKPVDQSAILKGLRAQAQILEETLLSFGIEAKVGQIHCGPSITSFEVHPPVGVKVQKIRTLENDIALNMKAQSIRIIAPIPGKAAVGIEVPNPFPQEVSFREMLEAYRRGGGQFAIPVLLGKTVTGEYVMADLTKMPHCIIAGATGSGKSVCINTIVMSILMNAKPDEIRLLMVDPKKVELTPYTRLPHMLAPVITEPQGAYAALAWRVQEMERRYELLKQIGMRNIGAFNSRTVDPDLEGSLDIEVPEKLSYIVCIIDELADLMMVSGSDIETPIARIAQMARAVGIHLILATQRPSREVITGLIKANFPTRICFKVSSRINSQIVLDEVGGESLLGNGDMLFLPPGTSTLVRAQGAFIRDEDISKVVQHICKQAPPNYLIESFDQDSASEMLGIISDDDASRDSLYDQAVHTVLETGNASTTFLQRKLKIGYARAASIMDQLEEAGVVSPADGSKARRILVSSSSLDEED